MAKGEGKVVAQNKKARHDYTIVAMSTLPLMRKAISGTKIQTVVASSFFIKSKSKSWTKTPKGPE